MKITVYGYQNETGKISTYKENLGRDYNGGQALAVEVEIPDSLKPYETVSGDTCIISTHAPHTRRDFSIHFNSPF